MYKSFLILSLLLLLLSCGKSEEKVDNAVLRANLALTRGDCDSAITILESEGSQPNNPTFIKTLASAYACKSGYKTTTLFGTDLEKVSDPDLLLRAMSTFTTSEIDGLDNASYTYSKLALDTLLYAGGTSLTTNPTSDMRSALFGSKGMELNSFAFYLSLTQLGKFSFYFGNASFVTGIKGAGNDTSTNPCYLDYNANVNAFLDVLGTTGVCVNGSDEGHPELVDGVDLVNIENACTGITLFNNFVDTLDSFIDTFTGDDFSEFANISTAVELAKLGITAVKPTFDTRIFDTTSQARCESLFDGNDEDIMYFYAAVFETLHR
ncbi:hypothetical protein [Halobacteriovorax sp. JY17]|uniref:hypothetical protein n=1 Tax=Halobacteriovorax sp. JY17 TaxID=2014617 RepID=UPI000C35FC49|nr:hypothetical protein [Halobacteriovorax sp. JY17]PIK16582.1 MAG: hypothetical protein CES88_07515 [Halobacteriovorax sp. JY17]